MKFTVSEPLKNLTEVLAFENMILYHLLELMIQEPYNVEHYMNAWRDCNLRNKEPSDDLMKLTKQKIEAYYGVTL